MSKRASPFRIVPRIAVLYVLILIATETLVVFYYLPFGLERLQFELAITFVLTTLVAVPFVAYLVWQADRLSSLTEKLRILSRTDQMTGLLNRQTFLEELRAKIARAPAATGAGAFVYIDADHFKQVNDRYGHAAGDALLCQLAALILAETRRGDLAARLGGEEFALFLPGANRRQAASTAERLRRAAERAQGGGLPGDGSFSISLGIALHRAGTTGDHLMDEADKSLYAAKAAGRNAVFIDMERAAA